MAKQKAKISPVFLRIKAFIVDLFIIAMPLFYGVTYLVLGSKEALWRNQAAIALIWLVYGAICAAFYARSAQTPGYKLAGLYLIDVRSGRKVSFFRALARFGCFVFAGFSVIGLLICFFRKDRLNLHDLLSGAAPVVRKDAQ